MENATEVRSIFKEHTDEELKTLAIDLAEGKVFTDRHLNDLQDITSVFMLIGLGAFSNDSKEELLQIGMIYEYLSEAGPISVNGLPTFLSLRVLNKAEAEKMLNFYNEYVEVKKTFIQNKQ